MPTLNWIGKDEYERGVVNSIHETDLLTKYNISLSTIKEQLSPGDEVVRVSERYFRPTEVELLIGNPQKAKTELGWEANTSLDELVRIMIDSDFEKVIRKGY